MLKNRQNINFTEKWISWLLKGETAFLQLDLPNLHQQVRWEHHPHCRCHRKQVTLVLTLKIVCLSLDLLRLLEEIKGEVTAHTFILPDTSQRCLQLVPLSPLGLEPTSGWPTPAQAHVWYIAMARVCPATNQDFIF